MEPMDRADLPQDVQNELERILRNPSTLTTSDVDFLNARRDYLTPREQEDMSEFLSKQAPKKDAEIISEDNQDDKGSSNKGKTPMVEHA